MPSVAVAFDVTHARLNRTGLGRYPAELRPALERLDDVRLLPVSAARGPAGGTAGRIARGLAREALYYPAGLARQGRRRGADVLHCATPAPVLGSGLPLVVTVHDVLPLRMPALFPHTSVVHMHLSLRFAARATRIVTNSEYTRADLIDAVGLDPARVVATPFGIDARFAPRAVEPTWLAERFGVDSPYVLVVGTLEPRKNLVGALRAFEHVARARPDAQLVITGGRGWRNEAFDRALAQAGPRVRLTGFVEDDELISLYAGADCFLFPSVAEGFGFPPLEAMACGAPVVAGNRTALPEVLGDAALLADPEDPEALADAVLRVLNDRAFADDLRARGRARAAVRTWDACAAATRDVYRAAVRDDRPSHSAP